MRSVITKKLTFYFIGLFLLVFLFSATSVVVAQANENETGFNSPDYVAPTETNPFPTARSNNVAGTFGTFGRGLITVATIVNLATSIAVSLAFLFFFYNLFKYIKEANPEGKEEAKAKMGWSVLAIIVITSLWGIIAYFRSATGINGDANVNQVEVSTVKFFEGGEVVE